MYARSSVPPAAAQKTNNTQLLPISSSRGVRVTSFPTLDKLSVSLSLKCFSIYSFSLGIASDVVGSIVWVWMTVRYHSHLISYHFFDSSSFLQIFSHLLSPLSSSPSVKMVFFAYWFFLSLYLLYTRHIIYFDFLYIIFFFPIFLQSLPSFHSFLPLSFHDFPLSRVFDQPAPYDSAGFVVSYIGGNDLLTGKWPAGLSLSVVFLTDFFARVLQQAPHIPVVVMSLPILPRVPQILFPFTYLRYLSLAPVLLMNFVLPPYFCLHIFPLCSVITYFMYL